MILPFDIIMVIISLFDDVQILANRRLCKYIKNKIESYHFWKNDFDFMVKKIKIIHKMKNDLCKTYMANTMHECIKIIDDNCIILQQIFTNSYVYEYGKIINMFDNNLLSKYYTNMRNHFLYLYDVKTNDSVCKLQNIIPDHFVMTITDKIYCTCSNTLHVYDFDGNYILCKAFDNYIHKFIAINNYFVFDDCDKISVYDIHNDKFIGSIQIDYNDMKIYGNLLLIINREYLKVYELTENLPIKKSIKLNLGWWIKLFAFNNLIFISEQLIDGFYLHVYDIDCNLLYAKKFNGAKSMDILNNIIAVRYADSYSIYTI